jgi:hypothetical protein
MDFIFFQEDEGVCRPLRIFYVCEGIGRVTFSTWWGSVDLARRCNEKLTHWEQKGYGVYSINRGGFSLSEGTSERLPRLSGGAEAVEIAETGRYDDQALRAQGSFA